MKDAIDIFKQFKSNFLSREIFYCATGLFLLIVLNFLYKPTSATYHNWINLNDFQKGVVILLLAYFLARFCKETGALLSKTAKSIFERDKISKLKNHLKEIQKYINQEPKDLVKTENINNTELEHFIYDNNGISFLFERKIQHAIFEEIFLGFSFLLSIFYSPYLLIVTLLFAVKVIHTEYDIFETKVETANFFIEMRSKSKKESPE